MLANSYLTSDYRDHANVFVIGPYSSLKFVHFIKVLMFSCSKTCHDPGTKNGYTNPVTILTKDSALDSVRSWPVFSFKACGIFSRRNEMFFAKYAKQVHSLEIN